MRRQQVQLDGTVDASPIYLHAVQVGGAPHDVFFVTTTYGKTEAIDAANGKLLWRFTPPGYSSWAGSAQITTSTPVADPSRQWIYAASPAGRIYKLSVADGHSAWSVSITKLPSREKIAASLNFAGGHVIATTGGYIGDAPPYQGHVAIISAGGALLHVWNSLCSNRSRIDRTRELRRERFGDLGPRRRRRRSGSGQLFVATGNAPWDGMTNFGDAVLRLSSDATALVGNYTPTNTEELNSSDADLGSTSPVVLSARLHRAGRQGREDPRAERQADARTAPHRGGELQVVSTPSGTDLFTAPAVWHRSNVTWLFAADNGGTAAWRFRNGRLAAGLAERHGRHEPGRRGRAALGVRPRRRPERLCAGSGKLVGTLAAGGGHWNSPIVVDGRVALPEGNANDHALSGVLDIWRLR